MQESKSWFDEERESGMASDAVPAFAGLAWGVQEKEPAEATDEALAAIGDAASFTLLYRRHLRPVYVYLYARLGNTQEAEDLAGITFERAWASIKSYKPKHAGSFRGWLLTIAHRVVADRFRRKETRSVPIGNLEREMHDPRHGPEEAVVLSDEVQQVLQAMSSLSQDQQEVIGLRFLAGLSYKEIASIMRKREGAIKMAAYRALEEIRRRCGDEE